MALASLALQAVVSLRRSAAASQDYRSCPYDALAPAAGRSSACLASIADGCKNAELASCKILGNGSLAALRPLDAGYAIAARTRKFNDDYYNGEQLRDPGPGRRQPRQDAEGQRRDEEEAIEPIQDPAVAREEVAEVLDVRVALQHRRC